MILIDPNETPQTHYPMTGRTLVGTIKDVYFGYDPSAIVWVGQRPKPPYLSFRVIADGYDRQVLITRGDVLEFLRNVNVGVAAELEGRQVLLSDEPGSSISGSNSFLKMEIL